MEDLKKLATKKRLSTPQKQFLRGKAVEMGVEFIDRGSCDSCYQDLAVQLYNILNQKEGEKNDILPKLRPGVDIIFMGNRINAATITKELTDQMIKIGLKKYFE